MVWGQCRVVEMVSTATTTAAGLTEEGSCFLTPRVSFTQRSTSRGPQVLHKTLTVYTISRSCMQRVTVPTSDSTSGTLCSGGKAEWQMVSCVMEGRQCQVVPCAMEGRQGQVVSCAGGKAWPRCALCSTGKAECQLVPCAGGKAEYQPSGLSMDNYFTHGRYAPGLQLLGPRHLKQSTSQKAALPLCGVLTDNIAWHPCPASQILVQTADFS